jgi:PAS domain S-box-containing protein
LKEPGERVSALPVRILHLEDSFLDSELVSEFLRQEGIEHIIERVSTRDAFVGALHQGGYGLILADYQLPDFDGFRALDIAKEIAPGKPFIFVSGALGEELAVEGIKRGATDYAVKQRLERLPSVVKRALAENQRQTELVRVQTQLADSESRLRLTNEAAEIGTWDFYPLTGELHWDDQCRKVFGLGPEDPISYEGAFLPGLHPDDRERTDLAVRRAISDPSSPSYDVEYRTVSRDGTLRWVAAKGRGVFENGRAVRFLGTVRDITDRKRAEEAVARSEAALREESRALDLLNQTAAKVATELDLERLVDTVVDAGVKLTGAGFGAFFYNVVDAKGESYMLYALAGVPREAFSKFPMPRNTGIFSPTFKGEATVRSSDITKDPRYGHNLPHRGMPEGHLPVRSYLAVPVTSRSGGVIGGLFFGHPEPAVFTDRAQRLAEGLAAQAAIGIDNARLFQAVERHTMTLEAEVRERTAERDGIWRMSQDLLGVTDVDGVWQSVNPACQKILGWQESEVIGRTAEWLLHPDDLGEFASGVAKLAAGEALSNKEVRIKARDGAYKTFSWTAVPSDRSVYIVARDITEQRAQADALAEAEERLRQAQKMESLGQLTGGVAHDFNNLLQIVSGNLEILGRKMPSDGMRRYIDNAMNGTKRAATLTQRLLAFSRRQPLAPKATDPNKLVAGMSDLLHRTLGETIEVETVLSTAIWRTEVDANQLESAILNLAINARDAMPDGGKLTIETANTRLDERYVARYAEVPPGQYVMICVSDTGGGMDDETLSRAFEPFFTTKEVGKGTGLGLSMVYGFVKQSGGHVKIYSEYGIGTSVKIYLPRLIGQQEEVAEQLKTIVPAGTGSEVILVCEDDAEVRAFSVEALKELGYQVLEAQDGHAAMRLLSDESAKVDLLFTDVVLPGKLTGRVLAEEARKFQPKIKVLFTTGYARNAIVHQGRLDSGVELLPKPFSFEALATRVRDVLDRES